MKKLLAVLALLCAPAVFGQVSSHTAMRIIRAAALPTTCNVSDVYFKTAATVGPYVCLTANNWTAFPMGSTGISGTLGATDNAVLRANGAGGSTAQGSDFVVSDAAANVVTLSATATNALEFVGGNGSAAAPTYRGSDADTGIWFPTSGTQMIMALNGVNIGYWKSDGLSLQGTHVYRFNTSNFGGADDTGISRLGAASIAVGNGAAGNFSGTIKATNVSANALASILGNALAISATAPTATTGATQVGKAISVTASAAVASTDTAGAAVGGDVTITGGAAARFASGNAAGGNVNLVGGAGIGTGATGQVLIPSGTLATPSLAFADSSTVGIFKNGSVGELSYGGVDSMIWGNALIGIGTGTLYGGATIDASDVALSRAGVAGVWKTNSAGNSIPTWIQQTPARSFLASDFTNATATPSNTALSITVKAARKYSIKLRMTVADSVAGEGVAIDFDGGTATATTFRMHCKVWDTALLLSTQKTAIATDVAVATATGDSEIECDGGLVVNAAGTFIVRAFQNSHSTGTLTVYTGSWMELEDMP